MSAPKTSSGPSSDSLLLSLPSELSQKLFSRAHPTRIRADSMLFAAGDVGNGCYLLEEGLLKVTVGPAGKTERILAVLVPGRVVGELSMIDDAPRSATVTAIRDCRLGFVSRVEFHAFSEEHPELYRHLVAVLARRLRDTNVAVVTTTFLSLKGRVARALLDLAEGFGRDVGSGRILIQQKLTQSDVAAIAGIARENVSRILNEWMRASVVSRLSGYYFIDNKAALLREAEL